VDVFCETSKQSSLQKTGEHVLMSPKESSEKLLLKHENVLHEVLETHGMVQGFVRVVLVVLEDSETFQ
jgi:hypothetical protein